MKILFQNRADALTNFGGDSTQMLETRIQLLKLGITVDINLEPEPDLMGYDLVHIFNIQTGAYGIRQLLNAKKYGIPVVLSPIYWDKRHIELSNKYFIYHRSFLIRFLASIHNYIPYYILNSPLSFNRRSVFKSASQMLIEADLLLPNSIAELEVLALLFNMPFLRTKTEVVPNGIDVEAFLRADFSNNEFPSNFPDKYILQVGRIEPVKGQLNAIKSLMGYPEIPLVFIGRGLDTIYGKECLLLGEKRGNVFFLEQVDRHQLIPFYHRAKVHILPSLRESPGLVTLEAAICGANCVVSFHGPVTEYFGSQVWYCDPENIESIKSASIKAWESPRNSNLKDKIKKFYTWNEAARLTFLGYQRVIRSSITDLS
jgi:glycosyltransferase involved in cell wall biosynthesis